MAIIQLLRKQDLTEDKVNFVQTIEDVQILPHINRVLKYQLLNELQADLHSDLLALEGKDTDNLTDEETALYEYYTANIKDYCIVQAWFNHLEVGDVHVTPGGKRQFNEPQSNAITDSVFAGFIANAKGHLMDAKRAMLAKLNADKWEIGETSYLRDAEQAQKQAVSNIGFSVILPHHRHKRPAPIVDTSNDITVLEITP